MRPWYFFALLVMNGATLLATFALLAPNANAQEATSYQTPPQAMVDIANAPLNPRVALDPMRIWLLIIEYPGLSDITELAREELRLAGLRFNPTTNSRSRRRLAKKLSLVHIADGRARVLTGLPSKAAAIDHIVFSPDGRRLAFTHNG